MYFEEVTRDMPGFESWTAEPMNIEIPAQLAEEQEFLWRLPLKATMADSYINFSTSDPKSNNPVLQVVEWPIHYRYQPV